MLCQFTAKNYKSIREEMTFNMQAAAIMEHRDRIIETKDGEKFLLVSVIYGPNGGGKSEYEIKDRKISVEPFAFSEETRKEPTQFEVFFRTDAAEYRYILHMRQDFVMHDSLDRIKLDTGRRSALFVRNGSEVDLKGGFGKIKISGEISENLPLLSYLGITYKRNEIISDVIQCNKKLFGLLPFRAKSLVAGTTLVIDGLDAKVYPVLLQRVVMLYNNMEINKNGAQLIFTSHDLSTMNNDVFRRDEIWFAAKGKNQNSKLYSLVEFKNTKGESVRMDAKYDKQYLEGKYGADPYLKKIIDWSEVNA